MTIDATRNQHERRRRELLSKSEHIPPLPESVIRLLEVLNQTDTEPQHLERHLHNDPVLVARMLAMVNSPFFGLSRTCSSIKEAIMVLGFRGLRSLLLASSTAKFLQKELDWYGHDQRGLWVHSVAVAAGARATAIACRLPPDKCELLFVGGLLHDIGKLLLGPYMTEAVKSAKTKPTNPSMTEVERSMLGLDHGEAGALVAAKWNLGTDIQDIIEMHRDRTAIGDPRLSAIMRVADAVACECGFGYLPGRAPIEPIHPDDLEMLGLSDAAWHALRIEVVAAMDAARAAMARMG